MSRKPRQTSNTGIYHIILRSINQQQLFEEDEYYHKFLYILSDVKTKYPFELYGYCLMGNHIHLLIHVLDSQLKTIFQSLGARFVYWYNVKYQRFGHLFQERYISVPIQTDDAFLNVLQYIHENPVRAGICPYPSAYHWSSCKAYYGQKNNLITKEPAISIAGSTKLLQNIFHTHACQTIEGMPIFHKSMDDSEAMILIKSISNCSCPSDFQHVPKVQRNDYIRRLAKDGLHSSQISRLCGISRTTVYRILNS